MRELIVARALEIINQPENFGVNLGGWVRGSSRKHIAPQKRAVFLNWEMPHTQDEWDRLTNEEVVQKFQTLVMVAFRQR